MNTDGAASSRRARWGAMNPLCHLAGRQGRRGSLIVITTLALLAAGCISIPKEAPELSAELGNRIGAMETAHVAMLRAYMDQKRAAVDEFLMKTWVPMFAAELMKEDAFVKVWQQVCQSGDPSDRLEFLRRTGPRIQTRINEKRQELIGPLDELERAIERRLRDEYSQMKGVNNAVTSFLASAAKVAESRDRFLGMLGVSQQDVADAIDKADAAVTKVVQTRDQAQAGLGKLEGYKQEIQDAIATIKRKK